MQNGSLDRQEMMSLLEKMLGRRPAGAELRFFWDMIDMDDDGKISFREFSKAIRDCRAAIASARGEDSGTRLNAVMRKLGVYILGTAGVDLESAFDEFDEDGSGSLEPSEVVGMVKSLMPGAAERLRLPRQDGRFPFLLLFASAPSHAETALAPSVPMPANATHEILCNPPERCCTKSLSLPLSTL